MKNLAILASGEGTNLQALIDACRDGRIQGRVVLVVGSRDGIGALRRAEAAGIPAITAKPGDFPDLERYSAHLARLCREHKAELVCLAGFLCRLEAPMLEAFARRILNIHPALLPAFGGQGLYGRRVHETVLKAGVKVSGCTVHFVDEAYDHGPIAAQAAVAVLPDDTPESLAERVLAQEHWLYPKVVGLLCEGRLEAGPRGVEIRPAPQPSRGQVRRALLSVSDKTGLLDLARCLQGLGIEIISTSGTAKALESAGIAIRPLDTVTGFPEILAGRVKTLHPRVHGAILLRRDDPAHVREAEALGIEPIDLVVVNLYPFARTAAQAASPYSPEAIEQIDIGGVALIRAAAKNFEDVAVATSPADYPALIKELESSRGRLGLETRRQLALTGFRHTAEYDAMISQAWSAGMKTPAEIFPRTLRVALTKVQDLRYGENPHQKAAVYALGDKPETSFSQIQGKELSYNNILDAAGTWEAACEFSQPAAVIFKHVTPCGMAVGTSLIEALQRAWACDPLSAFGGVLAFNRAVEADVAELLSQRFVEVITAPGYSTEALAILKKKANLRLLIRRDPPPREPQLRWVGREVLAMEPDRVTFADSPKVASKRQPTPQEDAALRFAWVACKHVRSNAIVLAGPEATVGIGAGQMSRVDSVHMASVKYKMHLRDNPAPQALVMASDAFFPFRDSVDAAAGVGVSAVIQPGGSVRDAEVIAAADEHDLAMVLTGVRHFKH
ncbi:MAG TPA: bifunctional phosphoribosylaminoimidazolecarboxamide formyltransferase/inosine monophosphate cyclohydrolase [Elusimicrobia bacterium]|nr:bifunctional phosphoribosylaminoimidazolecarboxamide formyltransferase/inosine monophosphate cyclohydrolase [Elusimicrobiota bacterium]HBT60618.1 bifunctional phosphoribosylaminoimidazolecarboxamide formyltransferase/inosine monophosphate cyclohydrolase [Elusimicrobiota bacterium]